MNTRNSFFAIVFFSFSLTALNAQVAINNTATNPDASTVLDLRSGNTGVNKGFLPNSVALTATNSASPVSSPATGLIVYNTATAGSSPNNVVPGYYYWNGSAWIGMAAPSFGSGINNYVTRWTPSGNSLGTGMIQDNGSTVGINNPAMSNAMLTIYNAGTAIYCNSGTAIADSCLGTTYGVYGFSTDINGKYAGIYGKDAAGYGVKGVSTNSSGIYGYSSAPTGPPFFGFQGGGVYGQDDNSFGVQGFSSGGSGVVGAGKYGGYFQGSGGLGVYSTSSLCSGDSSIGNTYGVYAVSTNFGGSYPAVYGKSKGTGVEGYSTGGNGIYGYSTNGSGITGGVYGECDNAGSFGVYGTSTAGTGVIGMGKIGGSFTANGGVGVYSNSNNLTGDSSIGLTYGVYGYSTNNTTPYPGVYGGSKNGNGVTGVSNGAVGVSGSSNSYYGVQGISTSGTGVFGQGDAQYGVEGVSANGTGVHAQGFTYGLNANQTSNATTGVAAINATDEHSGDYVQLNAWNNSGTPTHYKVYSNIVGGSVTCAAVDLKGKKVLMHCPETPEFYYEDYGQGQLVNGKVHISLDSIYAKNVAISSKHPLRVFIQLEDNENCKGVVVKNKTATGFDVVELGGGNSNTPFEWHIVCNVKNAEENGTVNHTQDLRFEPAAVIAPKDENGKTGKVEVKPTTAVQVTK